eukprot:TRINITY_DN16138_c0_g1_i1.p1 TRINITY_DN16138_c0_g1~~TRINITY_DN16138_c0_g1_i1.p1  ORF type:complete len:586 (+),score=110.32 TRINITY_DN16138_c0_g1_i1:128-1885(+)
MAGLPSGQMRQSNKVAEFGSAGNLRRRQESVLIGKERRDTLLQAKRFRWEVSNPSEGNAAQDEMREDEPSGKAREAELETKTQVEAAVRRLQAAVSGPSKGSSTERVAALVSLRKLLSLSAMPGNGQAVAISAGPPYGLRLEGNDGPHPPVGAAVDAGVVPLLTECMQFGAPEEELVNAAWCLSNIAGGESRETLAVLPASALLIAHLRERSPEAVADHCTWAIGNLAAEGKEACMQLLAQGVLPALARLLLVGACRNSPSGQTMAQTAAWALSSILRVAEARVAAELIKMEGIPAALVALLCQGNPRVNTEAAWLLAYVTAKSDACAERLLAAGVGAPLLNILLTFQEPSVLTPAIRTLGNITAMDNTKTDALLAAGLSTPGGLVGAFARCLDSSHRSLQKEAAWAASNLAAGSQAHKDALINGATWPSLLRLFSTAAFDIRKEVAFVLGNACCAAKPTGASRSQGPPEVVLPVLTNLLNAGCLSGYLSLVRSPDPDAARVGLQFVEMVLRAVPRGPQLVEAADGIDALESLQFHSNEQLRLMASTLADRYFGDDYGLEEEYGSGMATAQPVVALSQPMAAFAS